MRILQITFLLLFCSLALATGDVIHLVGPGSSAYEKLSTHKMQGNLVESAEKYQKYGSVERATHHDMAFPRDIDEYQSMNGFGVIWVTSHSHIKEELPLRNFRIYIENSGTIGLDPIYVFSSQEANDLVAKVLGKFRSDMIFMIPFFEETKGATIVADYSNNRNDFVLGKLPEEFPFPIESPATLSNDVSYPNEEIFHAMLNREYPISHELIK